MSDLIAVAGEGIPPILQWVAICLIILLVVSIVKKLVKLGILVVILLVLILVVRALMAQSI